MALRKNMVRRFVVIYILMIIAFAAAVVKMFLTITVDRDNWLEVASTLKRNDRDILPDRGNIYSDDGRLISTTIPYYAIYMDTRVPALHEKNGKLYKEYIDSVSTALSNKFKDKSPREYRRMIDRAYERGDGKLKLYPKRISYIDLQDVKQFPLFKKGRYKSGLIPVEYVERENLFGSLAQRTVGNIYGSGKGGQYGLELFYDSILSGQPGLERGSRIGNQWIYVPVEEATHGCDLVTTIDVEMQDICESVLKERLEHFAAKSGCLILMEVKTGQIKSIVNLSRAEDGSYSEIWNMAMADMSEPGSTFKTLSLMIALDNNLCDTSDIYDINHGEWRFYDRIMTDHNRRTGGYDSLSVNKILANSSNVGVSRIIDENYRSKPMDYINAINEIGFADDLHLEIPGCNPPKLPNPEDRKRWSGVTLPWMSIGYEVQVPPIYTLNFYNAIANGGVVMQPYLVKEVMRDGVSLKKNSPKVLKRDICKSSTLKKVQGMLENVVKYGTAKRVASDYFSIAGKTGTAQLGYGHGGVIKHQVSFCGYFPADEPLYSCIVVFKEPQCAPSAQAMSGYVFKKVAERVYAQVVNKNLYELEKIDEDEVDSCALIPRVKVGSRKKTERALKVFGVDYNDDEVGDWVSMNIEGDELNEINRPILENMVPNVIGMGASDALFLLERAGLYVQIYGRGRVVRQSIRNGSYVKKGATISIVLR